MKKIYKYYITFKDFYDRVDIDITEFYGIMLDPWSNYDELCTKDCGLYAYTYSKKIARAFEQSRDMHVFHKCIGYTEHEDEWVMDDQYGHIKLAEKPVYTRSTDPNGVVRDNSMIIVMTEWEYMITGTEIHENPPIQHMCSKWVWDRLPPLKFFTKPMRNILHSLYYDLFYDYIYDPTNTDNNETDMVDRFYQSDITIDEFQIFLHYFGKLIAVE